MAEATDLKNGVTFESEGKPYKVIKYTFTKLGRGGATVRVIAKNLETGATQERTYDSGNKVEIINTIKRRLQYLYSDQKVAYFIDPRTFEQIEIGKKMIEDEVVFIKEGEEVNLLFWNEKPLSIEISPKVVLKVEDTTPGIKGNSATNIYKPASLENGMKLKVPLFINKGDKIVVDTRTGEYVERAK